MDAGPLRPVAGLADEFRARLTEIMRVGVYEADESALLDLVDGVADALHVGRLTVADHDALVGEISAARMTLR